MYWYHCSVMPYWVFFCDIIHHIFFSLFSEYVENTLLHSIYDPRKSHIYFSGYVFFDVPFMMLFDDVLSVVGGFCGYRWPISYREVQMNVVFWQFSNNPPNFASVADAMIFLIMLYST